MNNQWSDKLRKQMDTHQEPSPEGLWANIEHIMQNENSIKPLPKQEKKIVMWSKRIGAVAAIAIIVLVLGYYSLPNQENIQLAIDTPEKETSSNMEATASDLKQDIKADREDQLFSEKSNTRSKAEKRISTEDVSILDTPQHTTTEGNIIKEEVVSDEKKSQPDSHSERTENKQSDTRGNQRLVAESDFDFPIMKQKDESARWATNLYASNLSSSSTSKYNGYGSLSQIETEPKGYDDEPLPRENPYGEILLQNKYREVYTDVEHRQPITMGLSVNYKLNDRWSLTSGLTYTILSSQLRSGSANYYYNSEQTLHNIGIPLNINYNIWNNKKLLFYLSGGGLAEKNVSGKLSTDYFVDGKFESAKTDNISIDQLQWSINTSVGEQYNLTKRIGLYVEPGASYHFKNSSEIETIYKEKPLNMSLRFGISYSLGGR